MRQFSFENYFQQERIDIYIAKIFDIILNRTVVEKDLCAYRGHKHKALIN